MSERETIIEFIKKAGFSISNDTLESAFSELFEKEGAFISIPIKTKKEPTISINNRLQLVEDDLSKLKRYFELYLKTEFKEESRRVFIEMVTKINSVKSMYMKMSDNIIKYYILHDAENYGVFLDDIVDLELGIEESYPMLNFKFIHKKIDELGQLNIEGSYLIYSKGDL